MPRDPRRHRVASEGLRVHSFAALYEFFVPWPLPALWAVAFAVTRVRLTHTLGAHPCWRGCHERLPFRPRLNSRKARVPG